MEIEESYAVPYITPPGHNYVHMQFQSNSLEELKRFFQGGSLPEPGQEVKLVCEAIIEEPATQLQPARVYINLQLKVV